MDNQITFSMFTDVGGREVNEDAVTNTFTGEGDCFILCDGLGGHGMGDAASQLVTESFKAKFEQERPTNIKKFLQETFVETNEKLLKAQVEKNAQKKMKTTAVALICQKNKAFIGYVGDSRLYAFNDNKVLMHTLDHSIPQMLVLSKEITEDQIRNHPDRNMLMKVMGVEWDKPQCEILKPLPLRKCQAFLLCSDGFWELIEEADMCKCLAEAGSVEEWINKMAEMVKKAGEGKNMDNNSAIGVWVRR